MFAYDIDLQRLSLHTKKNYGNNLINTLKGTLSNYNEMKVLIHWPRIVDHLRWELRVSYRSQRARTALSLWLNHCCAHCGCGRSWAVGLQRFTAVHRICNCAVALWSPNSCNPKMHITAVGVLGAHDPSWCRTDHSHNVNHSPTHAFSVSLPRNLTQTMAHTHCFLSAWLTLKDIHVALAHSLRRV
jgi:hypothetical protein